MRPSFAETWLNVAEILARRATCPRLAVGAVLVNAAQEVISTGYNGAVRGQAHCADLGCSLSDGHCWRAIHAEENAIIQAARSGQQTVGATLYCTAAPCPRCARMAYQAGILKIVYTRAYGQPSPLLDEFQALGMSIKEHAR